MCQKQPIQNSREPQKGLGLLGVCVKGVGANSLILGRIMVGACALAEERYN